MALWNRIHSGIKRKWLLSSDHWELLNVFRSLGTSECFATHSTWSHHTIQSNQTLLLRQENRSCTSPTHDLSCSSVWINIRWSGFSTGDGHVTDNKHQHTHTPTQRDSGRDVSTSPVSRRVSQSLLTRTLVPQCPELVKSDVLPDYLERKDKMASKQYEKFMNILRKAKKPGWTSDHLNFIVGSKTINESAIDANLERLGINQKNKKKIKAATVKSNIHGLLNILKAYYANTHQDSPKPETNKGTDDLQLTIDTRQALDKRPPHTNQDGTRTLTTEGKHTKRQTYEGAYASLMSQVNYTEGTAPNNIPSSVRTLLQAPSRPPPNNTVRLP
jgi:hypothetical protein